MAIRTLGVGRLVRARLGLGILRNECTAVAGGTLRLGRMIHRGRCPRREVIAGSMAGIASPGSRYVVGRLGQGTLAGVRAAVTGGACFAGQRMIHFCRLEGGIARSVAILAGSGRAGGNVNRGLADGIDIVVTARTTP